MQPLYWHLLVWSAWSSAVDYFNEQSLPLYIQVLSGSFWKAQVHSDSESVFCRPLAKNLASIPWCASGTGLHCYCFGWKSCPSLNTAFEQLKKPDFTLQYKGSLWNKTERNVSSLEFPNVQHFICKDCRMTLLQELTAACAIQDPAFLWQNRLLPSLLQNVTQDGEPRASISYGRARSTHPPWPFSLLSSAFA